MSDKPNIVCLEEREFSMNRRPLIQSISKILCCLLPLALVLVLIVSGIMSHFLWAALAMVVCCLAMFYLMGQSCESKCANPNSQRAPDKIKTPKCPDASADCAVRGKAIHVAQQKEHLQR
ncbi:MAG: hypothetical protein K2R98_15055 [Gemmataceae bacterium]|nr:hypothetical protein [Gemmataceae bacterium]